MQIYLSLSCEPSLYCLSHLSTPDVFITNEKNGENIKAMFSVIFLILKHTSEAYLFSMLVIFLITFISGIQKMRSNMFLEYTHTHTHS